MSDSGTGAQPPIAPGAGQQPAGPSVCPRHPDREAYVKCQRCGRPACPECQRPAAVGIQCVDCVREAARTAPTTRTVFGGRPTDGRPIVTQAIIGICVVVFLVQWVSPGTTVDYAFAPSAGWIEPWRFVTAMFLHAPRSLLHIGFNLYALFILGSYLEPLMGRARLAALYLISGIGGQVSVLLFAGNPTIEGLFNGTDAAWATPVVGASGAIFGLFGALIVLNRHLGRSAAGMYGVLLINGVLGFVIPNISWQAHLGGFVTGLACAGAIVLFRRQRVRHLTWLALSAVLALLVVISVGKYLTVPVEIRDLTAFRR
ncbi:rhomboid family intramembrane serine protease [Intrasporangium calvum]|uniref:Rhomboid family protein n=1 Tax=Intrasporangium calvum (strain ATCC 23552 / DSM 43043 / JCM 3097 / NBRC 12989 / NCIMB 10167 / NRRL B-3866 / 7 KIP) TaxID=710696 RepID=E6SEL9_INTC7|nr:rhomboid family intramembrane serine protease [Intrasporangium calvum]ADU46620.1 Rhomboid family protein [Intrasporangium calvum DSM 43043]